jgi:hypothetical protein
MILLEEPIYILNCIDIYRFTPVSGCVAKILLEEQGNCPAYPYVKTSLIILPIILCNCCLSVTLVEQEVLSPSGAHGSLV